MASTNFLFVNKDSSNLTSKTEIKSINSHVQRKRGGRIPNYKRSPESRPNVPRDLPTNHDVKLLRQKKLPPLRPRLKKESTGDSSVTQDDANEADSFTLDEFSENSTIRSGQISPVSVKDVLSMKYLDEDLDPFVALPGVFSDQDKKLLHCYLKLSPVIKYGMSSETDVASCPMRQMGLAGVTSNELYLQAILLIVESFLKAKGISGYSSTDSRIFVRKAKTYRLIHERVDQCDNEPNDLLIAELAAVAIGEFRTGELGNARRHLVTVRRLAKEKGEVQTIPKLPLWSSITAVIAMLAVGSDGHGFKDYQEVSLAAANFRSRFSSYSAWFPQVQKWRASLQSNCRKPSTSRVTNETESAVAAYPSPISEEARTPGSHHPVEEYSSSHKRCLELITPLKCYIECALDQKTVPSGVAGFYKRRYDTAFLYILVITLWQLRDDPESAAKFLETLVDRLYAHVGADRAATDSLIQELGGTFRPSPSSQLYPNVLPAMYIVIICTAEFSESNTGIMRAWESVKFVELMELTSDKIRGLINAQLVHWILGSADLNSTTGIELTDEFIGLVVNDILLNWELRNVRSPPTNTMLHDCD